MKIISSLKKWRKSLDPQNPFFRFTVFLLKCYFYVKFKFNAFREWLSTVPRRLGYRDPKFEKLRALKDAYKGKRCFIACTGPSLTIEDLESLKDEYVFGMNSICMIHDKTNWKPDFFAIQDVNVYKKIESTILNTDNGLCMAPYGLKKIFNTPDDWVYFPMCGSYHLFELQYQNKFFSRFSSNPYVTVYDGYSITYSIMQLAIYMGFKEIYLIGCDCNYMGQQQHFIEHGHMEKKAEQATDKLTSAYMQAKISSDKLGVKIYNSTRGGLLEVYPRKTIEEVLSKQEMNKRQN